ncbi:DUF1540 domain-containing protein [Vallitalea okinawensis]|uniref:DUF1540 domain-containing protein n=1 Tax=Vallitalea okinawensis TaxID=2078660 RepID=UPI000CFD7C01|nr:DUF1540 domain-containing protein [Vallitalea okinawensis]
MDKNMNIGCNVNECRYHNGNENYCTLQHIDVVKHNTTATTVEETDCGSFQKR